jgi:hypothetical protein
MDQVVKCLLSKCKALSSTLSTKRKKLLKEGKKGGKEEGWMEERKGRKEGRKEDILSLYIIARQYH